MNEKPSLAFTGGDPGQALLLSRRLLRLSRRLDDLANGHITARTTRALQTVGRSLRLAAGALHPTAPAFATVLSGRRVKVALVDSTARTIHRLLPCREAGADSILKKDTVATYQVVGWPTLALALEYAREMNRINRKIRVIDKKHSAQSAPLRRQRQLLHDRLRKKATAIQHREMQKRLAATAEHVVVI